MTRRDESPWDGPRYLEPLSLFCQTEPSVPLELNTLIYNLV